MQPVIFMMLRICSTAIKFPNGFWDVSDIRIYTNSKKPEGDVLKKEIKLFINRIGGMSSLYYYFYDSYTPTGKHHEIIINYCRKYKVDPEDLLQDGLVTVLKPEYEKKKVKVTEFDS